MRGSASRPRIAWIPPCTDADGARFDEARTRFGALGFDDLECVDIDVDRDDVQIAYLHEFDIVYLSGGDAVRFRYNAIRAGLLGRLRQRLAAGGLIVAASGGSMLLTPNVSLFRLQAEPVADVVATRERYGAVGAVPYELLPHANRFDAAFMAKVEEYSCHVDHDIVALDDAGALIHSSPDAFSPVGRIRRYRRGNIIEP
jgi:peptidase E